MPLRTHSRSRLKTLLLYPILLCDGSVEGDVEHYCCCCCCYCRYVVAASTIIYFYPVVRLVVRPVFDVKEVERPATIHCLSHSVKLYFPETKRPYHQPTTSARNKPQNVTQELINNPVTAAVYNTTGDIYKQSLSSTTYAKQATQPTKKGEGMTKNVYC